MSVIRHLLNKAYRLYGLFWNFKANSVSNAMRMISQTANADDFWKSGKEIALSLMPYVTEDDVVLDFGCGIGRVAKFMSPHVREVWCVDASSRMLKFASKELSDLNNVHFLRANGLKMQLKDEMFDFAYSILTLQHLKKEDAYVTLCEIYRLLKIGGLAYFSFPNFLSKEYFQGFLKNAKNPDFSPIRIRLYTPQEVEKILSSIGFKVLSLWNPNPILEEPVEITPIVEK
jgi:ubiquinone/menaquinone biosynthesis C-methylase UbiE